MEQTPKYWSFIVRGILSLCRDKGLANDAFYQRMMKLSQSIDRGAVDINDFAEEYRELVDFSGEPMIAWKMAPHFQYSNLGPAFVCLLAAPDLKTCIQDLSRLRNLFVVPSTQFSVALNGNVVELTLSSPKFINSRAQLFDFFLVFVLHLGRTIAGSNFDLRKIQLPASFDFYDLDMVREHTRADVTLQGADIKLEIDKKWLAVPSLMHNPMLRDVLQKSIDRELMLQRRQQSFAQQVVSIFNDSDEPATVSLTQVCEQLAVSESTARRKLKDEGTSFSAAQKWWLYQESISRLISTDNKIESIALQLGYAERTSFERAFKSQAGVTAAKFRLYSQKLNFSDPVNFFRRVLAELPPMAESCQQLMQLDDEELSVSSTERIIAADPIFTGRVMGLANRAIYGAKSKNLSDAIGRKLGVETVKNLAFVYVAKDQLGQQVQHIDVNLMTSSILTCNHLYKEIADQCDIDLPARSEVEPLLLFGLLGIFLLFHRDADCREEIKLLCEESDDFLSFTRDLHNLMKIDFYATSSLLLAAWGVDDAIVRNMQKLSAANLRGIEDVDQYSLIQLVHSLCIEVTLPMAGDTSALAVLAEKHCVSSLTSLLGQARKFMR